MHSSGHNNRRKTSSRRHLCSAWLTLGLCAGGCSHTANVAQTKDPLLEAPVAPVPNDRPASAPTQSGAVTVPPIPTTLASTNNASLASLPGSRPLSIPERNQPVPGQLTNTSRSGDVPTGPPRVFDVPNDTGVPTTLPPATSSWSTPGPATGPAPVVPVSAPVATPIVTTDNFAKLLAERGFTLQHLRQSSLPGGTLLVSCIATQGNSPEQSVFEVTAPSFDDAGQAILREASRRSGVAR
jgi:hypothetical protein